MDTLLRKAIDALQQPDCGQPVISIGDQCFGLEDGSVINWRGQNYKPQRPSLRVRLHNWLVSISGRRYGLT
jgi:hypothetical protein